MLGYSNFISKGYNSPTRNYFLLLYRIYKKVIVRSKIGKPDTRKLLPESGFPGILSSLIKMRIEIGVIYRRVISHKGMSAISNFFIYKLYQNLWFCIAKLKPAVRTRRA